MKFSDAMDCEWLNDHASDYSVARRILFSYHPLEPEMWLTLANQRFPQVDYQGTLVDLFVPLPDLEKKPKMLQNYEASDWRSEEMPFIEFLRKSKSNNNGHIIRHIQDSYHTQVIDTIRLAQMDDGHLDKEATTFGQNIVKAYKRRAKEAPERTGSLAAFVAARTGIEVPESNLFANSYQSRGEKLVAAGTYSMLNDRYYGQWVVLHKAFRQLEDLEAPFAEELAKVPPHYKFFTLALLLAPEMWRNDPAIQAQMELEAHNKAMVETVLHKVKAQRALIDRYLSGELMANAETLEEIEDDDGAENRPRPKLTTSQKKLRDEMKPIMARAIAATQAEDDEEIEALQLEASKTNRILFASGPPGHRQNLRGALADSSLAGTRCPGPLRAAHRTTRIRHARSTSKH